jgi:hypothetical protein
MQASGPLICVRPRLHLKLGVKSPFIREFSLTLFKIKVKTPLIHRKKHGYVNHFTQIGAKTPLIYENSLVF